jgi:uncharacterized membrane protein
MFDSYNVLKTIHVLAAIVWIGGALTMNILGTRLARANEPARLTAFARDVEWIGQRVYLPASITVLLFGIFTVLDGDIGFTTLWVVIGLLGIVITALTGSIFLGPESKRVAEIAEQKGVEDPEVHRRIARLFVVSRIDLVVLVVVVADMVLKPT